MTEHFDRLVKYDEEPRKALRSQFTDVGEAINSFDSLDRYTAQRLMDWLLESYKDDPEARHSLGDDILRKALIHDGQQSLVDAFDSIARWCA